MAAASVTPQCLIVDCQLLQTSDRRRGMGFFLRSLLLTLAELPGANITWYFILNSNLPTPQTDDLKLLKRFNGTLLEAPLLSQADAALFADAAARNRQLIDGLVRPLAGAQPPIFFIPALFSREIYPVFPTHGTRNLLLFHDLIPFLYHRQYFHDHEGPERKDYAQRFYEVYRTDLFVTNSQTTADDLTIYCGVDPSRVVAILGGPADRSHAKPVAPAIAKQLEEGFVFMPSGDDFRKNNTAAVQAFARLQRPEKLVVTSKFGAESQRQLRDLCPNVVFAGSVSDGEFLWLLDHAKAVFFPPLYEGLGMPILEAMERGARIVCARIPVFLEIDPEACLFVDPLSVADMSSGLELALQHSAEVNRRFAVQRRHYPAAVKRFSWALTAERFVAALKACRPAPTRKQLAVFCPEPSSYSSVGKYAFEVHAELSRYYDIDYYIECGTTQTAPTRPNLLEFAGGYYPAASFDALHAKRYDQVLYHIGNSEFHVDTILQSLRLPAAAIIHDTWLNGIFDYMQRNGFLTLERRDYEALLDKSFGVRNSSCLASIVSNQRTAFCHSIYAEDAVREIVRRSPPVVRHIVHPIGVPAIEVPRGSATTVSFAGIISEDKGIHLVQDVSEVPNVQVCIFGFGVLGDSPLLQNLGNNVSVVRDLTDKEFQDATRASDVLINYRPNYHGETSRSTLEAMRYGVVVIVKDVGWYGELPNDVVVKVTNEVEALEAVRQLVAEPQRRRMIGEAARAFLADQYNYARYARLIKDGMEG